MKIACALFLMSIASISHAADGSCSAATLKGQYVFTGRGSIEAAEPGIQRVHYGVFRFDGRGGFVGKQSSSRGGKIGRETLSGTYTLDADCSGSLKINPILKPTNQGTLWDMYATDDGKRGHVIRMDEGNMAVRSFEK
ncbi:MAG: hypothetical protein JO006_09250 [Paucibacter sp.]|nr:hypothetical protein [Roseateles sp.]